MAFGLLILAVVSIIVAVIFQARRQKQILGRVGDAVGATRVGDVMQGTQDGVTFRYKYYAGSRNSPSYFKVIVDALSEGKFRVVPDVGSFDPGAISWATAFVGQNNYTVSELGTDVQAGINANGQSSVFDRARLTTCPWDCEATPDGFVGITDLFELFGQWTMVGTSCDFDGGGAGIPDLFEMFGNWGVCP